VSQRPVIYFSPIPWRGLHQRPQHTALFLAASRRVLFVEPRTLHAGAPPADEENLAFLSLPVIPTNARRPALRRLARLGAARPPLRRAVEARQVRLLADRAAALGLERPLLLFGHPEFHLLRRCFPSAPIAYDHMDDVLRFGDPPARLRRALERLAREARLVSATSRKLAEQMESLGVKEPLLVGNGVEWERFAGKDTPPAEPEGLADLPRPRAVYVGSVAEWFDLELLFALAERLPTVAFPVIGPVRPALSSRLRGAPANLRCFGARPYEEVPAWLAHCQAALIPFRRTPLTEAVDPVKVYEYLAAGLPVVSTPFSPELRDLAGPVTLADDASGFAEALERLLATPRAPDEQRAAAAPRRWERQLACLADALDDISN